MFFANRGRSLEKMIEVSNQQYILKNKAMVQKIPTPVKVLNINSQNGRIKNGFYEKKSTVDYVGVYDGLAITYDAKETQVDTRFDLKNIKEHQYNYLSNWQENGGFSFLIIYFTNLSEAYLLPFKLLQEYWKKSKKGGRKSIPYNQLAKDKYKIYSDGYIILDYISTIDQIIS